MPKIEEQFKSYQEKVIPAGASAAQLTETRRAFYAGAAAAAHLILDCDPNISDEALEADIINVRRELQEFADKVKGGKA